MNLTELGQYNAGLAKRMELLVNHAKSLGANDGVQRLALVGKNFKKLSIEEAYRLIDPSAIQSEVEEVQARKYGVGRLHILRNCLALGPLLFTWYALYRASTDYQLDLKKYPNDLYEPFLKLWQYGFHNTTWFNFSTAALFDVGLLSIYLLSILMVVFFESKAQKQARQFAVRLYSVTDDLIDAVTATGTNSTSSIGNIVQTIEKVTDEGFKKLVQAVKTISDADTDKIAQALKQVIEEALETSKEVAKEAQKTIADLNAELQDLVNQFHNDLGTLSADLLGYDKQLQELTNASTDLANASNSLASNADDLTKSTQAYGDIGKDISSQIGALSGSQQKMVTAIGDIQKDVATKIAAFAGSMDSATKATEKVAKELGQVTVSDIDNMTKRVSNAADHVADAADALAQVQGTLSQADKHLQWSLIQADKHLHSSLSKVDSHLQGSIAQIAADLKETNRELQVGAQILATAAANLNSRKVRAKRGGGANQTQVPPSKHFWQFWK